MPVCGVPLGNRAQRWRRTRRRRRRRLIIGFEVVNNMILVWVDGPRARVVVESEFGHGKKWIFEKGVHEIRILRYLVKVKDSRVRSFFLFGNTGLKKWSIEIQSKVLLYIVPAKRGKIISTGNLLGRSCSETERAATESDHRKPSRANKAATFDLKMVGPKYWACLYFYFYVFLYSNELFFSVFWKVFWWWWWWWWQVDVGWNKKYGGGDERLDKECLGRQVFDPMNLA